MFHQPIYDAEKSLNRWISTWIPSLASYAESPEASAMVANLAALTKHLSIQLGCISEQATHDQFAAQEELALHHEEMYQQEEKMKNR